MGLAKYMLGHVASQFTNADDKKPLEQLLAEAREHYAAILPHKVDADTRLESVEVRDRELVLHSTLFTISKDEIDPATFQAAMTESLSAEAQRLKRLARILAKGGALHYIYKDKNGDAVTEFVISAGAPD